jgi:DNA polymerase III alpha subunit
VAVIGLLAASRSTPTRADETMAFLTLDDSTGTAECTLFPAVLRRCARELPRTGGALWAAGRAEEQYGVVVTLTVESLRRVPC